MTELIDSPLADLAHLVRSRETSFPEIVEAALVRAAETEPLHAVVELHADEMRSAAAAHQTLLEQGYDLGPLQGLPIALKDNIDARGYRTRAGGTHLDDRPPLADDAEVTRRLRRAGAVVAGKTNMHEYAWGSTTTNPHFGAARNPWDTDRIPGGSSGGSGIPPAVGSAVASLGTDTGGSIRMPAAFNNLTGIRPTIGRISTRGILPLGWTMDTVGPLARTAEDCALVFDAIAGPDAADRTTRPVTAASAAADLDLADRLSDITIAVVDDYSFLDIDPDVEASLTDAIAVYESLGARIERVRIRDIDGVSDALMVALVEPTAQHREWLDAAPQGYGADVRALLDAGRDVSAVSYIEAQRFRSHLQAETLQALRRADVLITPTTPFGAPRIGETTRYTADGTPQDTLALVMRFCGLASMTGIPALSVPAGLDSGGVPIGVQLMARPFAESVLFRVAHALQRVTDHHLVRAPRATALAPAGA